MKKITPYLTFLVLLLTLSSNSCDEDILDVEIFTEMSRSIDLHLNQGQETINENYILDLKNDDTKDFLNKIKDVRIQKLTYRITSFSGDPEGSIAGKVYIEGFSFGPEIDNIKRAFDNNTTFEISNIDELNTIAELLKKNNQITVNLNGESACPNSSVDFTVEVTALLDITANPL